MNMRSGRVGPNTEREKKPGGKIGIVLIALAISLNFNAASRAARPLVTDDLGTVDEGAFELELGYASETPRAGGDTASGLAVQLKRGLTSSLDLGIELPYSMTDPTGTGDAVLHVKLKLLGTGEDEGLAGRLDIKLANADADADLGSGHVDYSFFLICSKTFGDIRTHYNIGYTLVGIPEGEDREDALNYSAAAEMGIAPKVDIAGEYYAVSSPDVTEANVLLGMRFQATDIIRLDAGYSAPLNDDSNDIATAGLTAEF